ncbi:hypothetical protein Salat_2659000 [Sesamum alatum]|uniref:Uncharacterized protein n=1 Tax=Sesamum alatum TaxID=300844 RepID=A0AAE1XQ86_9LAMI|nr:hypothetical protein Salat_2659000 [Sesamum alatum]
MAAFSLSSSVAGNPNGSATAEGADEDTDIRSKFNYSKFSSLADRVLGEGDGEALRMLERFKARWTEKYGLRSNGTSSASVGAIIEATTYPICTEGCGVVASTSRVVNPSVLPRVSDLMQDAQDPAPVVQQQPMGLSTHRQEIFFGTGVTLFGRIGNGSQIVRLALAGN